MHPPLFGRPPEAFLTGEVVVVGERRPADAGVGQLHRQQLGRVVAVAHRRMDVQIDPYLVGDWFPGLPAQPDSRSREVWCIHRHQIPHDTAASHP